MSSEKCLPFCRSQCVDTLRPRQYGRHFADDSFKCIFLNENISISFKTSLKLISKGDINNIPGLVDGSDNGLSPERLFYQHIYASLGLNELDHNSRRLRTSVCLSDCVCLSYASILHGFFPYVCTWTTAHKDECNDLWIWPISSRSFSNKIAKIRYIIPYLLYMVYISEGIIFIFGTNDH